MPARSTRQRLPELGRQVRELAAQYGIEIVVSTTRRSRAYRAMPSRGRPALVVIRPITGQVSYLVALHELAHLLSRGNRSLNQLEREADAWRWALQHSLVEPTPATCRSIRRYLESYYLRAMQRKLRGHRHGAKIPDADSRYWQAIAMLGERGGAPARPSSRERKPGLLRLLFARASLER